MLRDATTVAPAPPCSCCGEPSEAGFWGARLCRACHVAWQRDAPALQALELAHADAHPEDVEARGVRTYAVEGETDLRWVILKRGASEQVAKQAARSWLMAEKSLRGQPREPESDHA